MPTLELDISWDVLRRIVHDWAGAAAELTEVRPLTGGCINTTLALTLADGGRAVLKISEHRVNRDFAREAHQLQVLRSMGLPVPAVYACHIATLDNPNSYLLMEFIDGVNLSAARQHSTPDEFDALQRHLAEIVLAIHSHTAGEYHRTGGDDFPRFATWPEFYRHVYDPIWADVVKSALLPPKPRKQISRIHERLDRLVAHADCPRLVHWDIWSTNLLARRDDAGRWRISGVLDPNCKYAHAEAEIAYMELFRTVTPAFLSAYQHVHKLASEYHQSRRTIYQLYPLINHVHLFGHEYVKPLLSTVERAAALV